MAETGKVDRAFLEEVIYPRLGADREDVALGPRHGADFGVIEVGGAALALATDPLFVLRDLGIERAAWFAFHVVVSDVALSGLEPTHLSVDVNLPPGASGEEFAAVWEVFDREAEDLGVAVATGHTGRYAGCSYPTIGGATALAVGDPDDLVLPTGARPGDRLLLTKGPAIETTAILATRFGDDLDLPDPVVEDARGRFREMSPVRDALAASAAGPVTAMHDATERGVEGALFEFADAGDVSLHVERGRVPVAPGVREVCGRFGVDPWRASSSGTVLLSVAPDGADAVLSALADEGVRAAEVGGVRPSGGPPVVVDGEPIEAPDSDPFWPAYTRALEEFG